MDELKADLDTLQKCIKNLSDFLENANECENITHEEYFKLINYLNKLENRSIDLEIKIENEKSYGGI